MATTRIQTLAEPLRIGEDRRLFDKNTYVVYWIDNVRNTKKVDCPQTALDFIKRCTERGVGAFASAPIPCNNYQHGVFAFSRAGRTAACLNKKDDVAKVVKAFNSVFGVVKTEPAKKEMPVQVIQNDETCRVVAVQYHGNSKLYTFRCKQHHEVGHVVCVYTDDPAEYKNVTVVKAGTMKESAIKAYAAELGYADISWLYAEFECDSSGNPIEEEEYVENIAELEAMKECFAPVCDYVVDENPDGYSLDNDYDDLPE